MKIDTDLKFRSCLKNGESVLNPNFRSNSQFNEDVKIFKRFFSHSKYVGNGVFVEMGGQNGVTFSNSLMYEFCLGWTGLLIEANPVNYGRMIVNRPCTNNYWAAGR